MKMLKYLMLVTLASAALGSVPRQRLVYSAATPAQIRFANENKYDGTGPGAKDPETNAAYKTYGNIEEALVAYFDDPDTKLPAHERAKALDQLDQLNHLNHLNHVGYDLKRPFFQLNKGYGFENVHRDISVKQVGNVDISPLRNSHLLPSLPSYPSPFRWQKLKEVRPNPLSLSHYTQAPDYDQYDRPSQHISLDPLDNSADGVHLSETRAPSHYHSARQNKDPYRGYFTYWDSTGERTVHYKDDTGRL